MFRQTCPFIGEIPTSEGDCESSGKLLCSSRFGRRRRRFQKWRIVTVLCRFEFQTRQLCRWEHASCRLEGEPVPCQAYIRFPICLSSQNFPLCESSWHEDSEGEEETHFIPNVTTRVTDQLGSDTGIPGCRHSKNSYRSSQYQSAIE